MSERRLTHGSTFSGIGAPEIAAEMLGWESVFHCEINPFGRQVLDYYFPKSESYEDITKQDFTKWRGQIDVLTGGFCCQPFSTAGKRRGAEDDRYLWPSMLRCIQEVRPTWFIGENVAGIATMVFPGEDVKVGSQGTLFGETYEMERRQEYIVEGICSQLEGIGYSVQPMLIPACAVGAPHKRDRIFFIAHRDVTDTNDGADGRIAREDEGKSGEEWLQERDEVRKPDEPNQVRPEMQGTATDTCNRGRPMGGITEGCRQYDSDGSAQYSCRRWIEMSNNPPRTTEDKRGDSCETKRTSDGYEVGERWANFPTVSPVRSRYDGFSYDMVRYLNNEVYDAIKEFIGSENLSHVREEIFQKEVWEKIRGLHSIPIQEILLQILFCDEEERRSYANKGFLSIRSKEVSERVLRNLRKQRESPNSPQRRELEEQLTRELGYTLLPLSYEITLAALEIGKEIQRMRSYIQKESLKAYGNAIVVQVMYEIFRAIDIIENK